MRRGGLLLTLAIVAGLGTAAPAHGALTIGSNLATAATTNTNCSVPCTTANISLIAANQASSGLTSPIDGVAVSFTVKSGSSGSVALRILRPAGGLTFTGVGNSGFAPIGVGTTGPIPTALAIKAGDSIGLDNPADHLILGANAGATQVYWNMPPLAEGSTRAGLTGAALETLVQASIEPDVDCDRQGDETQDPTLRLGCMGKILSGAVSGNTLNLQVQCPLVTQACDNNSATLATATAVKLGKAKATASAKKKRKKKKKPKAAVISIGTATFSIPAGQTQTVAVPLSGRALALFRQRRSVSVNATITGSGKTLTEPFTATAPKPKKKKKKKKKK